MKKVVKQFCWHPFPYPYKIKILLLKLKTLVKKINYGNWAIKNLVIFIKNDGSITTSKCDTCSRKVSDTFGIYNMIKVHVK